MKNCLFFTLLFCKFILINSANKPSSYDPIVITRNFAETLGISLSDSEEIIRMTKEMKAKTSKELYDWLSNKIGDVVGFFDFNKHTSRDFPKQ